MSLRSRLGRMLRGALRLLSCLTAALSTSANVTSEALEVVEVHAKVMGRVLSEVSRGGELELEQGCLVAGESVERTRLSLSVLQSPLNSSALLCEVVQCGCALFVLLPSLLPAYMSHILSPHSPFVSPSYMLCILCGFWHRWSLGVPPQLISTFCIRSTILLG
jgi:hypothetical protein